MASPKQQLEDWARAVLGQMGRNGVEDSFVELKARWPEPKEVARQLAGHANAARGQPILWLIGVDERRGVVDFDDVEPSTWFAQVKTQFEGDTWPDLDLHLRMTSNDRPLIALRFRTDRAPYQVKNPEFRGGAAQWEIPWREASGTRTARREDLLRILVKSSLVPSVEVLTAEASVNVERTAEGMVLQKLHASAELYVVPASRDRVALPAHRCSLVLDCADDGIYRFDSVQFHAPDSDLKGIAAGSSGALVDAPGILRLFAAKVIPSRALFTSEQVELVLRFETADAPGHATVRRIPLSSAQIDASYQKALWRTYTVRDL